MLIRLLMPVVALAVACGGSEPPPAAEPAKPAAKAAPAKPEAKPEPKAEAAPSTPEERGKALFNQPLLGSQAGCMTCHAVTEQKMVGPGMKGLKERAATRVEGQSAEEYIRNSILKPNDHVVEGYTPGLMPQGYEGELIKDGNDEMLKDLMAYLMTL